MGAGDSPQAVFDVEAVRRDFPIFQQPENRNLIYFDNPATTQRPVQVLDAIRRFHEEYNSNTHRSAYKLAEKATAGYECARLQVAQFIGARHAHEIIFTAGATQSLNFVAYGWARKFLKAGDEILVTELEHHSNLVPWQETAKRTGATLKFLPIDGEGRLQIEDLETLVSERTRLAAITHASNVLGTRVDVKRIIEAVHAVGGVVVIDGVQYVPHNRVNVEELNADFYAFSGHKMLGPMGIGILYGKEQLLEAMDPVMFGGSMIDQVHHHYSTWAKLPWKFEAGTQNIPGVIGLGAAIDFLEQIGLDKIEAHCRALTDYALQKLQEIELIKIYCPDTERNPVISFTVRNLHPHDLATFFDSRNIAVRSGHHCAQLVMRKLGVPATARIGFYLYNTFAEIDRFIDVVGQALGYFARWI
ncbi:MAG: SufS family cysteine desulfurase [candidate division KSB1 bacterium]|nr:SufS family cysteine desulfurase [candidate division KSB1 bacterium]